MNEPTIESLVTTVKRGMRRNGAFRPSNADAIALMRQGLPLLKAMVEAPYSPEADHELEELVNRYNEQAFWTVVAADMLLHPKWPAWHRLLQIRFLQLACADRQSIAAVIRKHSDGGQRPTPDRLMREVFRQCLIETIAWGKANKDLPKRRQALRPKTMQDIWNEAWTALDDDLEEELRHGRTIESAPSEWYAILGADYSLCALRA